MADLILQEVADELVDGGTAIIGQPTGVAEELIIDGEGEVGHGTSVA